MSRVKMKAIEYNLWRSVIKLIMDEINNHKLYSNRVYIKPSYPRDITTIHKPSIIVRKINTDQSKIAMGNFIGQIYDDNKYSDVNGILHTMMLQFDIVGNGNIENSLLSSIVTEEIMNKIIIEDHGRFPLYDFTGDANHPIEIGNIMMDEPSDIVNFATDISKPNLNNDYISIVRQEFITLQEIIPQQDYIDLSKWIKQTITIN